MKRKSASARRTKGRLTRAAKKRPSKDLAKALAHQWQHCFRGSYGNGPDINILEWAGVTLNDEESDALWGNINETGLIELTDSGFLEIENQIDDAPPGLNDTYYIVVTRDVPTFKSDLRNAITMIVRKNIRR